MKARYVHVDPHRNNTLTSEPVNVDRLESGWQVTIGTADSWRRAYLKPDDAVDLAVQLLGAYAATDQLLLSRDVAAMFGVDIKTVVRWSDDGKLRCFRTPGGHRRFRLYDVLPLLEAK